MAELPLQWLAVRAQLNPVRGSEQAGERPVLVVSHEAINAALPIVTVLPMTTHRSGRRVYPTEVLLAAGKAGQPHDSLVMAHQFRTISKERLRISYGSLEDEELRRQVRTAMRLHLDLE